MACNCTLKCIYLETIAMHFTQRLPLELGSFKGSIDAAVYLSPPRGPGAVHQLQAVLNPGLDE